MSATQLLGVIDAEDERLLRWLQLGRSLGEPVGEAPHALPETFDVSVSGTALQLLDTPVAGWARVAATAGLVGTDKVFDVFSTGVTHDLRPGVNVAVFDVRLNLGSNADVSAPLGSSAALSLHAAVGGELRYRHYLPVLGNRLRSTAYDQVITGSPQPNLIDLRQPLEIGEVHRLDAKLSLDLEAEVSAGAGLAQEISIELSDGLAAPFRMDVAATLRAALGVAWSARMAVVVARAGLDEDSQWTRVRVQRESERRLSFGLTFGLDLHYDLGTGLAQLFEEAVDAAATPRLVRAAREILRYGEEPELLRTRLEGEAAEVLEDLLAEGITENLAAAVPFARQVVETYDQLDAELQSLWDRLLSKIDPADPDTGRKVRDWLGGIAALDSRSIDLHALLGEDVSDVVMAIEALSGRSLEDLVLTGEASAAIDRAAELARRALELLDVMPGTVLEQIRDFARRTGIEDIVRKLRDFQSKEALGDSVRLRLRRVAEQLVGKVWEEIDDQDLAKVRAWAEKAQDYLSFADLDDPESRAHQLKSRIAGYLRRAKVDYGLTLAFEIERVARTSALIDVEIDPDGPPALVTAFSDALRWGRVRQMVEALFAHVEDDEDDAPAPFRLRECVFLSEKIRTTAFSAVFKMIGLGRDSSLTQRSFSRGVEQASLRVRGGGREGEWSGGYLRGDITPELAGVAGAWLQCADTSPSGDVRRPFDGERRASLRLVASFEDATAQAAELRALDFLLRDLGLLADRGPESENSERAPSRLVPEGAPMRLAVEVRFALDPGAEEDPLGRVLALADDSRWDLALLNAAHRWLDEKLIVGGPKTSGFSAGKILSEALEERFFVEHGHDVGHFKGELLVHQPGGRLPVRVGEKLVPIRVDPPGPLGLMLLDVVRKRGRLAKRIRALERGWGAALGARDEKTYRGLAATFAREMRRASLQDGKWPNPMFIFWLWLAAVNEMAPDGLARGRGFASLRWQEPRSLDDLVADPGPDAVEEDDARWQARVYTAEEVPDNRPLTGRDVFVIRR